MTLGPGDCNANAPDFDSKSFFASFCSQKEDLHIDFRRARDWTGRSFIDELVLREAGTTDFAPYAVDGSYKLCPDMFMPDTMIALSDCRFGPRLAHP